jgi:hypothetical protein
MERKINSLGKVNVAKMRKEFNFRTINEIVEHYDIAPRSRKYTDAVKRQALELLRIEYNNQVDELNRQERTRRRLEIQRTKDFLRNFNIDIAPSQVRNRVVPHMVIDKLGGYINFWNKKNNALNNPFRVRIKSGIADLRHTFEFKNIFHFQNWYEKVINQVIGNIDSANEVFVEQNEDIFNGVLTIENISLVSGGCNKHKSGTKQMKSSFYEYTLFNPTSRDNNCFFACLKHITNLDLTTHELRKKFNIESGTEITVIQAYTIIHDLKLNIEIRDYDTNEELDDDKKYIILKENHYYVLESWEQINKKDKKTKRGLLTFDFETRPTEEFYTIKATGNKMYLLKDALCCVYYKPLKAESKHIRFITNNEKSSARQLIDWFNEESKSGRTYNVLAHNGGKFDFYFFLSNLTTKELLECEPHFRGTTIISLNYRGNLFKDSCCFLTDKLSNLSKSFKINDGKIVKMDLHGKEITSEQLCFYRNELTFNGFLDLQYTDKEFWSLYEKYCLYDCIALFQIWEKFTICVNTLIEKINPYLLGKCPLMSSTTIGSHSKKIIVEINKYDGKVNFEKRDLEIFTGIYYDEERNNKEMSEAQEWSIKHGKLDKKLFYKNVKKVDMKKYKFLCNFKRGGISHCNQAGKHLSGITGVDINSQYPASLIYSYIPTGKSEWIYEYDEKKYGFYLIKNLVFDSYKLKPVALGIKGSSLNWATNDMEELYVDSYMLKYIIENYGLKSFDVVEGLVSNKQILSSKIFGKYINTFYDEKKLQDKYKSDKDERYNEALRSTIKLYLNSLTGKLVENPAIHFSLKFDDSSSKLLNGQGVSKEFNDDKINDWLVAGIMVYSYSKRLLFEYIKCLPNNSDDVIHIETDGIYFSTRHLETFTENLKNYKGDYPCMFGDDLGNLKIEKTTHEGQVAYFLGKKFYNITLNNDYLEKERDSKDSNIYRVKGIPQMTIEKDGTPKYLVNTALYKEIYSGKSVLKSFQTLKKNLFSQNTSIATFEMTRTIKPNGKYKLYM